MIQSQFVVHFSIFLKETKLVCYINVGEGQRKNSDSDCDLKERDWEKQGTEIIVSL